jgi:hypothetical protein
VNAKKIESYLSAEDPNNYEDAFFVATVQMTETDVRRLMAHAIHEAKLSDDYIDIEEACDTVKELRAILERGRGDLEKAISYDREQMRKKAAREKAAKEKEEGE